MVRVHFGPPLLEKQKNGSQADDDRGSRGEGSQNGLERRHLATVQWTVATAVAFPQKSESLAHHFLKSKRTGVKQTTIGEVEAKEAKMDSKGGAWQHAFCKGIRKDYGGLAQLGERLPCKQEVSGSIPLISTKMGQ